MDGEYTAEAGLPGQEVSPPSELPSQAEAQPSEQAPQYLTRDEALDLSRRLAQAEGMTRGLQSVIDRMQAQEQSTRQVTSLLRDEYAGLVREGVLDDQQASEYIRRAQIKARFDAPVQPAPQEAALPTAPSEAVFLKAHKLMENKGLARTDPEYVNPASFNDPIDWMEAVDQAVATKKARLAREAARQQAPAAAPKPASPANPAAAAMEVGAMSGAAPGSVETMRKQLRDAYRKGDYAARDRIQAEIDRMTLGGG